ncbi:MAG TPA: thiamine-phosphate pyrophosphorylase [Candidatus Omnitrophota bacterium]|nr:thiamine-phosphate pyrophosphorylase [Candidatus Omnitrophota bacterium]
MKDKIMRIVDANLNRSREGLRVCEDISRFALSSEASTKELRSIRHSISAIAKRFESHLGSVASSRDAVEDIGRSSRIKGGIKRGSLRDVLMSNMQRSKESLRVLEEFFKIIDLSVSKRFSRLRFKAYDVEKNILRKIDSLRNS